MSLASERTIRCFGDQFQYCLLTGYIKTLAVLKRQQFEDGESDAREARTSKHPYVVSIRMKRDKVQTSISVKMVDMFTFFLVCKRSQIAQQI